jgi:zinc ribbon protein
MPNCPVCGKEVQASTQYCPVCGTNLPQTYGVPSTQTPIDSQNYSYPQQGMRMPGTTQPHSHRKYIAAIVAALLIGLILGFFIGFLQPISVDYTTVSGTVSIGSQHYGTPDMIMFNSTMFGNLTAAVTANNYRINLPTGDAYAVSIQWFNATSSQMFGRCPASPGTFSSSNQTATADFSC